MSLANDNNLTGEMNSMLRRIKAQALVSVCTDNKARKGAKVANAPVLPLPCPHLQSSGRSLDDSFAQSYLAGLGLTGTSAGDDAAKRRRTMKSESYGVSAASDIDVPADFSSKTCVDQHLSSSSFPVVASHVLSPVQDVLPTGMDANIQDEPTCASLQEFKASRIRVRKDVPIRFKPRKVAKDLLRSSAASLQGTSLDEAIEITNDDKMAKSSRVCSRSRLKTWFEVTKAPTHEVTSELLQLAASRMRVAGYAPAYVILVLVTAKMNHRAKGFIWSYLLKSELKALERSLNRGSLKPMHATFDLPFVIGAVGPHAKPLCDGGFVYPALGLAAMARWCLREVETPSISLAHVSVSRHLRLACIEFSNQKNGEHEAVTLGCCQPVNSLCELSICCPCCSLLLFRDMVLEHHSRILQRVVQPREFINLPLFADSLGQVCSKAHVIDTINAAAAAAGLDLLTAAGARKYTGHTMRRIGLRALAVAGLSKPAITSISRHLSSAYEAYLDRCLAESGQQIARALGKSIKECPPVSPYAADVSIVSWRPQNAPAFHGFTKFVINKDERSGKIHGVRAHSDYETPCKYKFAFSPQVEFASELPSHSCRNICQRCMPAYFALLSSAA